MENEKLLSYTLKAEDEGKKYLEILRRRLHFSRKVLQKLKEGENVWVNGRFVYLTSRGKTGETLVVRLAEKEDATIPGEDRPLDILYEDSLFLAVNKPPGQVVHPTSGHQSGTLANAVVGYWQKHKELRPFRPVFRIDRNTSGIVLIAKNRYAHQQMALLSAKKQVSKKYLGIVQGQFPLDNGELSYPIRRKKESKILREVHPDGQPSLTLFRTLRRYANYTLVEFTLVTGRTHQIRVHCQAAGYPLLGDDLYGGDTALIGRQALHCSEYTFENPIDSRVIRIHAPLPQDMAALLTD